MKSLRTKRVVSGAIAAVMAAAVLNFAAPASADPEPVPDTASEALKAYQALQRKAEKLNEERHRAVDALEKSQQDLKKAGSELTKAKRAESAAREKEAKFSKVVDRFAGATYAGSQLSSVSAAMGGDSIRDYLDRSAAIDVIAGEKAEAKQGLAAALDAARDARSDAAKATKKAQAAKDAAVKSKADIDARKAALDRQVQKAKDAYDRLSGADLQTLQASYGEQVSVPSNIKAPGPAAQTAVDAAMSQRGKPYSYGAEGPDAYDCSGLTMWSYDKAGISLPHSSRSQSQMGQPVSRDQLQPGDLVFFYQPVSHVGMYIGGGKMVHAPQSGDVVKVAPVMWGDYSGARRVA